MEATAKIMMIYAVSVLLNILVIIFGELFMHYSSRYRNHKLSVSWYVCGVIFGVWTVIAFLFLRKNFPGPNVKACEQCGARYPENFRVCSNCVIDLPAINSENKKKEKKLSRIFGIAVIIFGILSYAVPIVFAQSIIDSIAQQETQDRIDINGVFYDKMGYSYEDEDSVILYDENGGTYTYSYETVIGDDGYEYDEMYYIGSDGNEYYMLNCFITEDGWFYFDEEDALEPYYLDEALLSPEEYEAYYEDFYDNYRYYYYAYSDEEGNIYYAAYEASWNEKGELITAENDIIS